MKKYLILATVLFSLVFVAVAFALTPTDPPQDTYIVTTVTDSGNNFNGPNLSAASAAGFTGCVQNEITYLKWDLRNVRGEASIDDPVNKTNLTLTSNFVTGNGVLELLKVADDDWLETDLTNDTPAPALGDVVASVPVPSAIGQIKFETQALADYVNEESGFVGGEDSEDNTAGDNTISLAIRLTGCTGFGASQVRMDAKEATAATAGTAPALNVFNPTAVEMQSFGVNDNNTNAIALVGLLLVVMVLGSFVLLRRRSSDAA